MARKGTPAPESEGPKQMALTTRTCPERYTVFVVEVDIGIEADIAAAAGEIVVAIVAAAHISAVVPCLASMGKATARQERLAQVPGTPAAAGCGEEAHRRVGHIRSPGEEARHIVGRIRTGRGRKVVAGRNTCFADIVVVAAPGVAGPRRLRLHLGQHLCGLSQPQLTWAR
jgi:hypothetical protein